MVPAGNPVYVELTSMVAAVMAPDESLVTFIVSVASPLPSFSAVANGFCGATSLAADNEAVNTSRFGGAVVVDVVGVLLLPLQLAAEMAHTTARIVNLVIVFPPQKNLRVRLKPRYRVSGAPPRASCPNVVLKVFANVNWNTCAPTRFSIPNPYSTWPGA